MTDETKTRDDTGTLDADSGDDLRRSARVEAEVRSEGDTRAVVGRVEIDAPAERVWEALTRGDELERWFPLEAEVEPGEGGTVWMSWKNEFAGDSEILAWDPPRLLRTSWGWSEEGPTQVTEYRIEGEGGTTSLRVVTSGFPADADWDAWVEGTRQGWTFELTSLKRYLEEHAGEDRSVAYLRRRVALSRDEAWDRLFGADAPGHGGLIGGAAFSDEPGGQYAADLDDPPGALMRISMEPSPGHEGARDVTVWLQAWGAPAGEVAELHRAWTELLERTYPEGETVQATLHG